jgi:hypothetical protein
MTSPIFTWSGLLVAPLFSIAPSLLILSGVTMIGWNKNRNWICFITAMILLAVLTAWSVPRIGWLHSSWLILEPIAPALLVAWLGLNLLRKRWLAAAIGSGLSAPFTIFGAGYLFYKNIFGTSPFGPAELVFIVPGIFVFLSLIAALCFRTE